MADMGDLRVFSIGYARLSLFGWTETVFTFIYDKSWAHLSNFHLAA